MGIINRLIKREEKEIAYDDVLGYLTKEDIQKLKEASTYKPRSKKTHSKWVCISCKKYYFYRIMKCPICESRAIEEGN